ncbi:MAG: hypothetical protein IJW67_09350 [Blautia sp.]|nr:hypothetical protein [Blautia sp.]
MVLIIAAVIGVSFYLVAMYACLVVGSRMDDEMANLYKRKQEEDHGDKRDKEDKEAGKQTGAAGDRTASGETV